VSCNTDFAALFPRPYDVVVCWVVFVIDVRTNRAGNQEGAA